MCVYFIWWTTYYVFNMCVCRYLENYFISSHLDVGILAWRETHTKIVTHIDINIPWILSFLPKRFITDCGSTSTWTPTMLCPSGVLYLYTNSFATCCHIWSFTFFCSGLRSGCTFFTSAFTERVANLRLGFCAEDFFEGNIADGYGVAKAVEVHPGILRPAACSSSTVSCIHKYCHNSSFNSLLNHSGRCSKTSVRSCPST